MADVAWVKPHGTSHTIAIEPGENVMRAALRHEVTPTNRLSCQNVVTEALDGLVVSGTSGRCSSTRMRNHDIGVAIDRLGHLLGAVAGSGQP